jgi:hypothetical protein
MRLLGLGMLLLVTLAGCAGGFLDAAQIDALGRDAASVCFSVQTPYGTMKFARTNIVQGNVVCDANGQTVQSDAQKIGIPLLVVPKVTVGEPTVVPR